MIPKFRYVKGGDDGHDTWQFLCCGEYAANLSQDAVKFCMYCGSQVTLYECRHRELPRWAYERGKSWSDWDHKPGKFELPRITMNGQRIVIYKDQESIPIPNLVYLSNYTTGPSNPHRIWKAIKNAREEWKKELEDDDMPFGIGEDLVITIKFGNVIKHRMVFEFRYPLKEQK